MSNRASNQENHGSTTFSSARERPLGLPDDAFAQKRPKAGLITKSEVRAVSLYHMGIGRKSVIWDVGAGTGSVAIESATIAHEGIAYAIERDEESLNLIRSNVNKLGPDNVEVAPGEAPDILSSLPDPNCVFVGGSGGRLLDILKCASSRLKLSGRIVVNLASIERATETLSHLKSLGLQSEIILINAARGSEMPDGATRLQALNPVFIVVGQKRDVN